MSVHSLRGETHPPASSLGLSVAEATPRLPEAAGFDQTVDALLEEIGYRRNPYFSALLEKRFAREDFVETQIAFCHQVAMFNRAMMLAATHIARPERRWPAVANVVDEHHRGDVARAHHFTIREFVRRVSGDPDIDIDARAMWPEVSQNVAVMLGSSLLGHDYGLSGLAMVERMFADISGWIAEGVVSNGWLSEEQLIHYNLHAQLDMRHADELFDVLREDWERGPESRYYVVQGMWVGGWSFNALYTGLWEARERRLLRDVRVAHTPW